MTEKPNNEGPNDDTVVRPPVRDSQPTRQVAPPTAKPAVATPPAPVRPSGAAPEPQRTNSSPSAVTPRRSGETPEPAAAQPVRKDPSAKAKERAAAAAAGPAASVGLRSGNAPGSPATASATPAAPASPVGAATSSTTTAATKTPSQAPTFTASEVLGDSADHADTQQLSKTDAGAKAEGKPKPAVKRVIGNPTTSRTRKARLRLAKVDPWSVMKTTFLFSIAFMVASLAAMLLLYGVISSSGVFDSINDIVNQVLAAPGDTTPFLIEDYLTAQRVAGFTIVIGVLNVVLITAIGTLAAFLYNLAASLLGGLEVTLAED